MNAYRYKVDTDTGYYRIYFVDQLQFSIPLGMILESYIQTIVMALNLAYYCGGKK